MTTRTWVCPKLCGCEINITAEWATDLINGKMYQHPKPHSITALEIVNTCPAHEVDKTEPIVQEEYDNNPKYIELPVSPTEAENLYIKLCRYTTNAWTPDTKGCDCRIAICIEDGVQTVYQHPKDTTKCSVHELDDDSHTQAIEECTRKNTAINLIKESFPEVTDEELENYTFNDKRELVLDLPSLDAQKTSDLEALFVNDEKIIVKK